MRLVLSEFKAIGTPFNLAWAAALRSLPRSHPELAEWKRELKWARPAFQAAYERCGYEVLTGPSMTTRLRLIKFEEDPAHPADLEPLAA
jgi:hypothetical protein